MSDQPKRGRCPYATCRKWYKLNDKGRLPEHSVGGKRGGPRCNGSDFPPTETR